MKIALICFKIVLISLATPFLIKWHVNLKQVNCHQLKARVYLDSMQVHSKDFKTLDFWHYKAIAQIHVDSSFYYNHPPSFNPFSNR